MGITSGPIDYTNPVITFLRLGSSDLDGIREEIEQWIDMFHRRPDYLVIHSRQLAYIELETDPMLMFPADHSSTHLLSIPYIEVFDNKETGQEWIIRR